MRKNIYLSLIISLMLILAIVAIRVRSAQKQIASTSNALKDTRDSLKTKSDELYTLGHGISQPFYQKLLKTGELSTSLFVNQYNKKYSTKEIKINMHDFIDLIKLLKDDEGLIFWPALVTDGSKEITYTIGAIREVDNHRVDDLFYFIQGDYSQFGTLKSSSTTYTTQYYDYYKSNVQPIVGEPIDKHPSRYYSKIELIEMLYERNIYFDDPNPNQYESLTMSIKGAAITSQDLNEMKKYLASHKPDGLSWEYHIGFTVILVVKGLDNSYGAPYEIGNPCPPRCLN